MSLNFQSIHDKHKRNKGFAKISKFYILTLPHPKGHEMSLRCEQPFHELQVEVWFLSFKILQIHFIFQAEDIKGGTQCGRTEKLNSTRDFYKTLMPQAASTSKMA